MSHVSGRKYRTDCARLGYQASPTLWVGWLFGIEMDFGFLQGSSCVTFCTSHCSAQRCCFARDPLFCVMTMRLMLARPATKQGSTEKPLCGAACRSKELIDSSTTRDTKVSRTAPSERFSCATVVCKDNPPCVLTRRSRTYEPSRQVWSKG